MTAEQASDSLQSLMEPRPNDMYTYETSVHIDAPVERVWEIAGDLGRSTEWAGSGQVKSMTKTSEGPVEVGTTYVAQEKILFPFKAESVIVGYEPNRFIAWTSRPIGPTVPAHRWAFILTPEDGGTRLTHQVRAARASGFPRVMQATMVKLSGGTEPIGRGMEGTVANIKARAES
ncbi:MAG TPA: SRPBCC family protein [Chloroflexota bacterium]|nr:SRPBCC family protein [Chloroflexota bacterium]